MKIFNDGRVLLLLFACVGNLVCISGKFEPYADHGGTVAGIAGDSYCVLAADSRLSENYMIRSREVLRLFALDSSGGLVLAGAGCWSDMLGLVAALRQEACLYSRKNDQRLRATSAAFLLLHLLYTRRLFPYYALCVLAGIDEKGCGALYRYDSVGSFERVAAVSAGRAEHLIQPFLDALTKEEHSPGASLLWRIGSADAFESTETPVLSQSVEEAVDAVVAGFRAAAEREISLGDGIHLWILRKDCAAEKRFYSLPKT